MNDTKFKSGDKVRIASCFSSSCWYADKIGEVFTILGPSEFGYYYVEEKLVGYVMYSVKECDIELVSGEWKDGIPQVGTICEAWYSSRRDWCEAEVLKVASDENGAIIAARELDTDYLFWTHDFRPIKTAEEIAAEEEAKERSRAIEEMAVTLKYYSGFSLTGNDAMKYCVHLYDNGYRLVE